MNEFKKKKKLKKKKHAETETPPVEKKVKKSKSSIAGGVTVFKVSDNELSLFKEIAARGRCKVVLKPVDGLDFGADVTSKDCIITFNSKNGTLTVDGR